tara:strand:+ start:1314 stop:1919 length:606 start_codon:yes stop_codon:yes gene_type:complete
MTTTEIEPITYPARPYNGGPLPKALRKDSGWYYEPKYNGWRTLIHQPTGTMFNRHGDKLSIQHEFKDAIKELQDTYPNIEWIDCEALGRRHKIGKGTLIVLDAVVPGTYEERRSLLTAAEIESFSNPISLMLSDRKCYLTLSGIGIDNAEESWREMQYENKKIGVEFYEGLVAKHADSHYPVQLRSPKLECSFWVKHRWAY